MTASQTTVFFRIVRVTALTVALLSPPAIAQDREPTRKSQNAANRLDGIVVDVDGQPVSGAFVALAHRKDGNITLMNNAQLFASGPADSFLLFFTKTNSRSAATTVSDGDGRFSFTNFKSPDDPYVLVAADRKSGIKLVKKLIPANYQAEPLRVQLDPPAYLRIKYPTEVDGDDYAHMASVSVAPPFLQAALTPAILGSGTTLADNVHLFFSAPIVKGRWQTIGPLVGGRKYWVSHNAMCSRTGAQATIYSGIVKPRPGESVDLDFTAPREGATLEGTIASRDGTPLRDVNVLLQRSAGQPRILGAITDKEGRYRILGVPEGRHTLELLRHAVRTGPG